jgi:hypothetical protein
MNDPVDLVQTVAIIFVMLILAYGVYLFKIELRAALMALRDIVREHDEIKARLNVLERERER